jgi:hypothetical protein
MYSAIVCVGPGEKELFRLKELLESLILNESDALERLIIVDDVAEARGLAEAVFELVPAAKCSILQNPRRSQGDAWRGGLTANTLFAFAEGLASTSRSGYFLRLDPDSLIIAPFHRRINEFFATHSRCGVVGSCYRIDLRGRPTAHSTWEPRLRKLHRWVRLRRKPVWHIEHALFGSRREIRKIVSAALSASRTGQVHGYRLGACAQGGGFAVRRELLNDLRNHGWLNGWVWVDTEITDDPVLSLLATAAGWNVEDFNQPGEVFGVQYQGLCGPPEDLVVAGYGIVHSLKSGGWEQELQLRESFRRLRRSLFDDRPCSDNEIPRSTSRP